MDKAVGERLPQCAVHKRAGSERERERKLPGSGGSGHLRQCQGKVGGEVPENQAAGGAAEFWEGKRSGAEPGHSHSQGKPLNRRVSWGRTGGRLARCPNSAAV